MDSDRRAKALALRLSGLTYGQMGEKLGVSRQRAQQLVSPPKEIRTIIVAHANGCCEDCGIGVGDSGHVHHRDTDNGDTYNNVDNLQLLCLSCHRKAHSDLPLDAAAWGAMPRNAFSCERCQYWWLALVEKPKVCPHCSSHLWETPYPEPERCVKCRYEWTPKVPDPKECPQCKSRYWQERIAKE